MMAPACGGRSTPEKQVWSAANGRGPREPGFVTLRDHVRDQHRQERDIIQARHLIATLATKPKVLRQIQRLAAPTFVDTATVQTKAYDNGKITLAVSR